MAVPFENPIPTRVLAPIDYSKIPVQDGGRADFSVNPGASLFLMMTYRMNLISAGSISLDSPFKLPYIFFVFISKKYQCLSELNYCRI